MSFLSKLIPKLRKAPASPRVFPKTFPRISAEQKIEEETFSDYLAARYYPVHIGDVYAKRYQVVGKLGFGASSTVWLARDLNKHNYVTLKVSIRLQDLGPAADWEIETYKQIASVARLSSHPGQHSIRSLSDNFQITGPDGDHHCLVHQPLYESVGSILGTDGACMPPLVLGSTLYYLFSALDFLHRECHLIHTDIKADNVVYSLTENDPVLEKFEKDELENPTPRKEVGGGRVIYQSRQMGVPDVIGNPVLCDFGSAMSGEQKNPIDVQPDLYRAPEVILHIPWLYEIDIWNVGCLIWDLFEGGHLFAGQDPVENRYRGRAHLGSIISLLGPPPPEMVQQTSPRTKQVFFNEAGEYDAGIPLPPRTCLEEIETTLKNGPDRDNFLKMMRKMLQWRPEDRSTAAELLKDDWLQARLKDHETL